MRATNGSLFQRERPLYLTRIENLAGGIATQSKVYPKFFQARYFLVAEYTVVERFVGSLPVFRLTLIQLLRVARCENAGGQRDHTDADWQIAAPQL
jgi:hypothetical protein